MADFRFIRDIAHYIFDNEKEFIDYWIHKGLNQSDVPPISKDWKNTKELDWVWSDDGRIVQLLKVGHMKNTVRSPDKNRHSTKYVRTIVGAFIVSKVAVMDTEWSNHPDRYKFSNTKRNNKDSITSRTTTTVREKAFVTYFTHYNPNPGEAYMAIYETKDAKFAERRGWFLLYQERIQMAIKQEVQSSAEKLKISDHWVLDKLKKIADNKDAKDTVVISAVSNIGKIIGTYDKDDSADPLGMRKKLPIPGDIKKLPALPHLDVSMEEAEDSLALTSKAEAN